MSKKVFIFQIVLITILLIHQAIMFILLSPLGNKYLNGSERKVCFIVFIFPKIYFIELSFLKQRYVIKTQI
nr:MAG TPA: hypothetical protein [Caudoviricetes sp.]